MNLSRIARLIAVCCVGVGPLAAATFTVTTSADAGVGSLRQAILDANANPGPDTIVFNIPGSDPNCDGNEVCTILPLTYFPTITDPVMIDGYTQAGAAVNTLSQGTNAALKIFLSGAQDGSINAGGFYLEGAGNSMIRGLAIGNFYGGGGIGATSSAGLTVVGCFIGTDASGEVAAGIIGSGIAISGSPGAIIGGTAAADRNLISNNNIAGINLSDCDGAVVQGNLIGTDASGSLAMGNGEGVVASGANPTSLLVGGSASGAGNVIAGNPYDGVFLGALGGSVIVQGNFIGTDASGTEPLGNGYAGIYVVNAGTTIGGIAPGEANIIANSGHGGVVVGLTSTSIRGNSIYDNDPFLNLGIDLGGIVPNDPLDVDAGPNQLQNFPIVSSAVPLPAAGGTRIQGVLHSSTSATFDLDFYANPVCPTLGPVLQGKTYIGSTQVTTDASGTGPFDVTLTPTIQQGESVSATATDPLGNTSQFSRGMIRSISPASGPAADGSTISAYGTDYLPGVAVTVGGIPAANVAVVNFQELNFTLPVLVPGTLNEVTLTDPDGAQGRLMGYLADFLDVPPSQQFHSEVAFFVQAALGIGVGGGNFGVDLPTLRQQMAVTLLKARYSPCYVPPPCTGAFADVPCPSPFADWIEALAAEGITGGCDANDFCPASPVLRQQMAVLLLKAKYGPGHVPPACTGQFHDVPCPSPFADWIEDAHNVGITVGCGGGNYCPTAVSSRGQMTALVFHTFFLPF